MIHKYNYLILFIFLSFWTNMLWAQEPKTSWILNKDESAATKNYVARESISLQNNGATGFHFKADVGKSFTAKIDAGLLFPPNTNTYALPNGTITTDKTIGGVVGSIPGQFGVSPSGGASYSIPIECPGGINGMQPKVSLEYNSQGGNGIAGWGWNISGMSSISRTGSNLYNDGKTSVASLTSTDNLILDGQRLILISGTNLADGAKYRTEIESYSDITYKSINGFVCFEVKTKDGLTLEFGSSANSYIHAQNSTIAITWLLTKVTDANGNFMTYNYGNDTNNEEFWLDKINYTYNSAAGITIGANEIDFIYTTGRTDSQTSYIVGKKIKQSLLLQYVITKTNSVTQREYSFTYSIADGFYNRLTTINEKGNDDTKYNPTVIDWNKLNTTTTPAFGFTSNNTAIGATFDNFTLDKTMIFVDFNNDGFVDLIRPNLEYVGSSYAYIGWEMYRSVNGQSFGTTPVQKEDWKYNPDISPFSGQYQLLPGDVNGDGLSDIVEIKSYTDQNTFISSSNIDVLLNVNGLLVRQNLSFYITGKAHEKLAFELGDFNGDGNTELILKKTDQSTYVAADTVQMYAIDLDPDALRVPICTTVVSGDLTKSRTTDVNGNGYPEIFVPSGSSSKFLEYNPTLNTFSEIAFTHNLAPSIADLEFGDFNGDGKTDVLQYLSGGTTKWTILMSTGTGFETVVCPLTRAKTNHSDSDPADFYCIKDLNGDGKGDIIEAAVGSTDVNLYYYNGSGFISTTHHNLDASGFFNDRTLPYYDINGDGKSDIVNTTNNSFSVISFSTPELERTVSNITNGMGIKNTIVYKLLSDNTVYTNGSSNVTKPVVKLCIPIQVASQTITSAGNSSEITNYTYKGLRLHTKGKGMLGFEEFTQDNITQDKKSITQFGYNSTYFNTYPTQQTVSTSTGSKLISTTTFVPGLIPIGLDRDHRFFPYTASQTNTDNLTGLTVTTQTSNFDGYGNPQTIVTTKGTAANTKIVETSTGTYIQKGSWCPNKVSTISSTKLVNGQTSTKSSEFTFDNYGNIATEIMDPSDVNSIKTSYQNYDSFGHCTLITKTSNGLSRSTSSTYTSATNPSGRFMSSKTNSLGETTYYKWDETKGQLDSETNRLGKTSYTYNGFGSLTETQYPDGIRKAQVLQWASPNNTQEAKYYTYAETSGSSPEQIWCDEAGHQLVKETYGLNKNKISVSTEYNADGKVHRISAPYFDQDASSKTWENTYTYEYGRLLSLTTPLGVSLTDYNGKTTTVTSPDGTNEVTINDAGQIIASKVNGKIVNFTYYPSGLTKTSTPEGGQSITMEYNQQGKRTKLIDPDGGTVETKYNGFGELMEEKQKVHNATNYVTTTKNYDVLKGYPLSVVRNNETTSYTYDTNNRVSTIEITGKNKQTFTYDGFDRITNVKEEIGARIYNTSKEYDVLGRVKKEIYPSGIYTVNLFDSYGHMVEVKDNASRSIWKANIENARGQLTSINKGSKETTFGFDSRGLPTSIVASGVEDMTYSFDTKGNLSYRTDNLTNQNEQFTYDGMNRLTNWDVYKNGVLAKQNGHIYDAATGNITSRTDLGNYTMTYGGKRPDGSDIGPHALATISGVPANFPTVDLNITYTDFKKIATLSEGTKYYALTYGVDDQRRKSEYYANGQSQGTATLTKYYVGKYEEEINALGNIRKIHYLSGGAMLIQNNGVDSLLYAYSDFQGSLIALTDVNGNVVEKYAYDPWGARRNADDWTQKDTRIKRITNRGYTGHEHIDAFGIINMNGRVYDPATGMFMSPDPCLQAPKDWLNYNRYSYCMGNPFKYTDPSGKFWLFRFITGAVGLLFTAVDFISNVIDGQRIDKAAVNAWKSGAVSWWNFGTRIDETIFGKPDINQNNITGQPGSNGITYLTSKGNEYQKFGNLTDMVNYMHNKSNDPGVNVEIVGYVLKDDDGNTYYYVLDWTGNTDESSNNPNENTDPYDNRLKFDKKYLVAEIHTHPKSFYIRKGGDGKHNYDGNSYKDYKFACDYGVPVYSIGPTTVSIITMSSLAQKEEDFDKIAGGTYKDIGIGIGLMDCTSNPFYVGLTSEWLKHPEIVTAH